MPTLKKRINLSLTDEVRNALARLSRRDGVPQATKALRLLETALELEEDQVWDNLATHRDTNDAHYISHPKAWR